MNLYEILGVDKKATADEIKKSYRRLAMKYHPDRNTEGVDTTDKFTEVQNAYEILSDPTERQKYDQFGHNPPHNRPSPSGPTGFHNINDIFQNLRNHYNSSSIKEVSVPVDILLSGGNIIVNFIDLVPEVGIRKIQSQVKIEPDTASGESIHITDQFGKEHDIVLKPVDTPNLRVLGGINLLLPMEFNALELASSEHITVKHPNGKTYKLNIGKRPIKTGTKIRIPNTGLRTRNDARGDFFIEIHLNLPSLSPEQKKNLSEILKEKS